MSEPLVITPVMQIDSWDCGVACLAMLLGRSMIEVRGKIPKSVKVQEGLGAQQMRNIATRLGAKTRWIRDGDLQEAVGILGLARPMMLNEPDGELEGHYVLLLRGVIYNPAEGLIWTDIDGFFSTRRWRQTGVMVRED